MIEVDLLKLGTKSRNTSRDVPSSHRGSRRPPVSRLRILLGDPWVLACALATTLCIGLAAYLSWSAMRLRTDLAAAVRSALQDSARHSASASRTSELEGRRDETEEKAAVIEEIDSGRYAWPQIMNDVTAALPDQAWIGRLRSVASEGTLRFQIEGRAWENLAVARFLSGLEASAFVGGAQLVALEYTAEEWFGATRDVYRFLIEAGYADSRPSGAGPES